ncbi:hypothetical protein DVB69_08840 [Sporosarcina sp. BI001-red]|uniref:hypothetical protein n=1 Tax=Sporosarcina sp. BI001-red TaxID=2282866 RepID=UPI000E232B40|nr:hypothetical protein [Sporosarcina sp. BI001-red]REB08067.1 hypothetical protein DVB69_08840 [Sporosarcina sp. BI001-red]
MEEKILQLLVGLTADVRDMKSDLGEMKSDVVGLKSDVVGLKSDVGSLKSGLENLHFEMNTRFDRVDNLLVGIGGQFEHQTEQRLVHDESVTEEFMVIKSRIFDLENKVNRAH